jgi:hypothetical protein
MERLMTSYQIFRLSLLLLALPAVHAILKEEYGDGRRGWLAFAGETLPTVVVLLASWVVMGAIMIGLAKFRILPLGAAATASFGLFLVWFAGARPKALWQESGAGFDILGPRNARLLLLAIGVVLLILGATGHNVIPE